MIQRLKARRLAASTLSIATLFAASGAAWAQSSDQGSAPTPGPYATSTPSMAAPSAPAPGPYATSTPPVATAPADPVQPAPAWGSTSPSPYGPPAYGPTAPPPPQFDAPVEDPDDGSKDSSWAFSVEGVTNAPVDIGGRLSLETPFRLRLSTGLGIVPGGYLGLINNAVEATGAYDELVAGLVNTGFDRGRVWRTQLGIRPFKNSGFYIDGGYARVSLAGSLFGSDVSSLANSIEIEGQNVGDAGYDLRSTIDMWLVEIGGQWTVADHLLVGFGVGVMGTVRARSRAIPNFEAGQQVAVETISQTAVDDFDGQLEKYGYVPTLTLRIGYRAF